MCREALKGYLEGCDAGLAAEEIAAFVDERETSGISLASAPKVAKALEDVTVVDPACGSGAYLLGMMQELVDLRTALFNVGVDARSLYELKLHIIQRNLYGVDIKGFAVNIAMLRMWLSLVIEYEGERPEPLPNLDFKVVLGDSLLGPDPSPDNYGDLFRHRVHEVAAQLADLKARYMKSTTGKDELREEVERVQGELRAALADTPAPAGAVDWRVEFAEVFDRGGFDVALANPPYVQLQKDGGKLGRLYKDSGYATFIRTGDIYYLFYERGISLLKDAGYLCYVSSNQWMRVESGKTLRRFIEDQNPVRLINLGAGVFDSATVNTCVLVVSRSLNKNELQAADVRQATQHFPPNQWTHIRPEKAETWIVLPAMEQRIKAKMEATGTPLGKWNVRINYGIKTGYNKAFIINNATKQALVAEDPRSADIIKPVLRGRDIQRYRTKWAGQWLITTLPSLGLSIGDYPAIKKYLLSFGKDRLSQTGATLLDGTKARKKTQHNWFELQDTIAYYQEFTKEKIVWGNLNDQAKFAYAPEGVFINAPSTILTTYSPYLLALLNSTLVDWYFRLIGVERDGGYYEYKPMFIERLPIPRITAAQQRPFIRLVDEILEAKAADPDADTSYLEWDIDRLVYDLYGLTEEEDTAIERSLGLIHQTDEEEDAAILKWIDEARTGTYVSEEVVMETLRNPHGG